jgi:hypothetical protein
LQVLRSRYDDFEERLAQIDINRMREYVIKEGLLPERTCYELLHCYRRSELQRAAEHIVTETIAFTAGIGLYATAWLEHLRISFVEWLESVIQENPVNELPLQEVLRDSRLRWPVLAQCEDAALEALVSLWPEVYVSRSSIFEVTVGLMNSEGEREDDSQLNALPVSEESAAMTSSLTSKKQVRERRATYKNRRGDPGGRPSINKTIQGDLWG